MGPEPGRVGVVVTRGEGPNGPLTRALEQCGARVLQWGSIAFAPPEDPAPLLSALQELRSFDWVCFSSPRAAEAVVSRIPASPPGVRSAAVGPSTAKVLLEAGWPVDRLAEVPSGEGMVEAFRKAGDAGGARVLLPVSALARDVIPAGLAALGAAVHQVTAYRTVKLPLDVTACRRALDEGEVQVITFASPSAMEGLRDALGRNLFLQLARRVPSAAMGTTTAGALRNAGWREVTVAPDPTLEGLAAAAMSAAGSSRLGREAGHS